MNWFNVLKYTIFSIFFIIFIVVVRNTPLNSGGLINIVVSGGVFYIVYNYIVNDIKKRWFTKESPVKTKLKIMFDLHGVSEKMPELIKPMMKTMRSCGHYVIICSGSPLHKLKEELKELGYIKDYHYDEVISVVDYLESKGVTFSYDENGDPWTDDETWFQSKGFIAKDKCVNIVIDDTAEYKNNMPANVMFWLYTSK